MKKILILLSLSVITLFSYAQTGSVASYQIVSSTSGNLGNLPSINERFGTSIDTIGDLNNDGITDLVVGAPLDNDGGNYSGAVFILYMDIGENPQANHSYIWSPAAGLNNPFIGNPTANPWVDTTVFVVVKTNSNTLCKGYDSVMITIPNPPVVSISGDTSICMGDTVHLVASGASNYVWKYGITTPNFDTLLPISQYITVTGTDANNCIGKDSVIVLVSPLPVPNLGNDTTIFMDSIVLNPGFFSSYLWNNNSTSATQVVHSSNTPGIHIYWVNVENQFGCKGSDTIVISITTDIATAKNDLQLKAYPNPTTNWLNIDLSESAKIGAYSIYDNQGKLVEQKQINANLKNLRLDFNAYARGKYYIQISINSKIQTLSIFVQ